MDWKLELVSVPVSDVDRAKAFYVEQVGFNADHDHRVSDELRFVQLTPPGSACSIALGTGITEMQPGSVEGCRSSSTTSRPPATNSSARGVEVSDVQEFPWGRFVFFTDPDGNGWALQQIVDRSLAAGGSRRAGRDADHQIRALVPPGAGRLGERADRPRVLREGSRR